MCVCTFMYVLVYMCEHTWWCMHAYMIFIASRIHFILRLHLCVHPSAVVWGTSVKHNPQRVGKDHVLNDEDVVQIVKK